MIKIEKVYPKEIANLSEIEKEYIRHRLGAPSKIKFSKEYNYDNNNIIIYNGIKYCYAQWTTGIRDIIEDLFQVCESRELVGKIYKWNKLMDMGIKSVQDLKQAPEEIKNYILNEIRKLGGNND